MADTTFISKVTVIARAWLQDVNSAIYRANSSITGVVAAMYRSALSKFADTIHIKDFGAVCDGVTDDTAAITAAIAAAVGKTLVYSGTPLISSTIVVSSKVKLVGDGARGTSTSDKPSSYFLKKSTMTTVGLQITATDVILEGGGVVSTTGDTGGGVAIEANGVTLRGFSAIGSATSSVGVRVGKDVAGANCNSWLLDGCNSSGWGSHGTYIHDNPGAAPNANSGLARNCVSLSNGGDAFRCDNASLNAFVHCLGELSTGNSFSMGNTSARSTTNQWCRGNHVIGGDYEASVAGQLVFNNSAQFCAYLVDTGSVTVTDNGAYTANLGNNYGGRYSYTPGIVGSTGADKSITATSFAGSVCTATSAAHGYSNGDYVWIRGASNLNINGVFVISNVAANTFDFTVRTDATFNAPSGSLTATARKCGVLATATGAYEYDKNKIFFHCEIVTSAVTNITGTLQLILPVPPANISATSWGTVNLDYYQGITHTGKLSVLLAEVGVINVNFYDTIGSGLTPAQFGAAGIAAATTIILGGWYFWQ